MGYRLPYAFRIYFTVVGIIKIISIINLFMSQLEELVVSYGGIGMGLLIYQLFSYILLILLSVTSFLLDSVIAIVSIVILSELSLILYSLLNENISITKGYILFSISNMLILLLSIIAIKTMPTGTDSENNV